LVSEEADEGSTLGLDSAFDSELEDLVEVSSEFSSCSSDHEYKSSNRKRKDQKVPSGVLRFLEGDPKNLVMFV
jgi:hypothetical protein